MHIATSIYNVLLRQSLESEQQQELAQRHAEAEKAEKAKLLDVISATKVRSFLTVTFNSIPIGDPALDGVYNQNIRSSDSAPPTLSFIGWTPSTAVSQPR